MDIVIDPEFSSLIPPLTAEEFAGLEKSIREECCRDALDSEQIIHESLCLRKKMHQAQGTEKEWESIYEYFDFIKLHKEIFSEKGWHQLSLSIREEANGTCQRCGCKSDYIQPHHIRPTKYGFPKVCDPNWIIALCPKCHRFVHSRGNYEHELIVVPEGEEL